MSSITIKRNKEKSHSAIPDQMLRSRRLSWPAKGLLSALLTFKDGETISKAYLIGMGPVDPETGEPARGAGEKALAGLLKELREAGYLKMTCFPTGTQGEFEWEYEPFEEAQDPETTAKVIRARLKTPYPPLGYDGLGANGLYTVPPSKVYGQLEAVTGSIGFLTVPPSSVVRSTGVYINSSLNSLYNSLSLNSLKGKTKNSPEPRAMINPDPDPVKPEREILEKNQETQAEPQIQVVDPPESQAKREIEKIEKPEIKAASSDQFGFMRLSPDLVNSVLSSKQGFRSPPGSASPPQERDESKHAELMRKFEEQAAEVRRREAEAQAAREIQAIDSSANQSESHFEPFDNPKTSTGLETKKVEVIKNPDAMLQRLQDAARNGSEKLTQFQQEHEAGQENLKKQAEKFRDPVVDLLALTPAEMIEKLYSECVDNPMPHLDKWKLKEFKRSLETADEKTLKPVIKAFKESKGHAKSLTYVLNKLDAMGVTQFTMKKAA